MDTLADTMEAERQRLNKVLEDIAQKRITLDQEERSARIELAGIQAYLDAKLGKISTRQVVNTKERKPRTRSGVSVKDQVLTVITEHPNGITKQDLLAKLNATDNKTMQNGISNALVILKKNNKVMSGERGVWKLYVEDEAPKVEPKPRRVKKEEATT